MTALLDDHHVLHFLAGGGEMGARMRAHNWGATSLGPPEHWPAHLRNAVSMLLPSKAQIVLFWGPDYITIYNDGYRPVFGAKHPSALGQPAREAWREVWDSTLKPLFDGVVRSGEAFAANDLPFVLERNGFGEEAFFDVSYDPVRNESGGVDGVYCIVNETTGRVVGERRLHTLRQLGFTAISASTGAVDACVNAARILADNPNDVAFSLIYLVENSVATRAGISGIDPESPLAPQRVVIGESAPWDFSSVLQTRAPVMVPDVRWRADALPTRAVMLPLAKPGQDALAGIFVAGVNPRRPLDAQHRAFLDLVAHQIAADIGNARAYEQEHQRVLDLAELDRAKTAFFGNVSHEFRTPLTLILGPLSDLLERERASLPAQAAEQLEVVSRNGLRLLRLVNTLLDFSRLEAGRAQATYRPTDLASLTTEIVSAFRETVERAQLRYDVQCESIGEPVYVDADMWEKIVLNLVSNAFKFTFDGSISVSLRRDAACAELIVRDTGTGIAAEELPRLFDRFHRVEGARGRTHEGSGIGLALVQELVELHGGTVTVASELGRGTAFTVRIPLGAAHLEADRISTDVRSPASSSLVTPFVEEASRWLPPSRESQPAAGSALKRRTGFARPLVFVADDNADMRGYVTRILSSEYDVEEFEDGEAALAGARTAMPSLIITDVMMPRLDGFGLLRALRDDAATRSIPVIMLSARAGEEARVDGLDAGANDYLVKPFSARELLARVQSEIRQAASRKQLEESREALRVADKRKDEFLATLAHELRNPLAPLRNMLEVMKRTSNDPHVAEQARAMMERQVASLTRLVDDLLDVSRITRNKLELRKELCDLASIINQALETCRSLADEMGHRIEVSLPARPVLLDADPVRMAQVLANLLNNACKYTPPSGRISIEATLNALRVKVVVRDSGYGIPDDMLGRIFELFAQAEQPRERAQGGLGIGLTLVKRLVEMHGGSVGATSEGPGKGSTFTIDLPVATIMHTSSGARVAPVAAKDSGKGRMVLVVDDNVDSADSLAMLLQTAGFQTACAHDGLEAISAAERLRPDAILLDIGMPNVDGHEACRRIRALPGGAEMRLIALTGWGQAHDRELSRAAGFDAHLVKPVSFPDLTATLTL